MSAHYGFTPFAQEHLLYASGHVRDAKKRVYIMGGKDADGKRLRITERTTLLVIFPQFTSRPGITHLWVQWKDGRRKLVHRKPETPWSTPETKEVLT